MYDMQSSSYGVHEGIYALFLVQRSKKPLPRSNTYWMSSISLHWHEEANMDSHSPLVLVLCREAVEYTSQNGLEPLVLCFVGLDKSGAPSRVRHIVEDSHGKPVHDAAAHYNP